MEEQYLDISNEVFTSSGLKGVRVCFEHASWNSSDGNIKTYYHIHVQHDDLPNFNSGVGDSNFDTLIGKVENHIIPELKEELRLLTSKRK